MDVMDMRRRLLMVQITEPDLYPIGTDLYDGVVFGLGDVDRSTGELISGTSAVSDFLRVSAEYEYTRSYRLYGVYNYDANFNYLGYQNGVNDLNTSVIDAFIPGTKYIRAAVHGSYRNASTGLIGRSACWLKRTA